MFMTCHGAYEMMAHNITMDNPKRKLIIFQTINFQSQSHQNDSGEWHGHEAFWYEQTSAHVEERIPIFSFVLEGNDIQVLSNSGNKFTTTTTTTTTTTKTKHISHYRYHHNQPERQEPPSVWSRRWTPSHCDHRFQLLGLRFRKKTLSWWRVGDHIYIFIDWVVPLPRIPVANEGLVWDSRT